MDSNHRIPASKAGALPLGDIPICFAPCGREHAAGHFPSFRAAKKMKGRCKMPGYHPGGANGGNRTRTNSLEGCCAAVTPHPHIASLFEGGGAKRRREFIPPLFRFSASGSSAYFFRSKPGRTPASSPGFSPGTAADTPGSHPCARRFSSCVSVAFLTANTPPLHNP